jgi:sulfotransferase famil protein
MIAETFFHRVLMRLPHRLRRAAFRLRHPEAFWSLQCLRTLDMSQRATIAPYDEHGCILIGVPKSATTTLFESLFGCSIGNHMRIEQYQLVYSKKEFDSYFKFAFVRNPWDRLVSAFSYLKGGGMTEIDREWAAQNLAGFDDVNTFVLEWLTPENADSWVHFVPQYKFVCARSGKLLVDFVGRFENLAEDYAHVCRELNVDRPLEHINRTPKRSRDYRDCYNDETRRIVADVYRRDIDLFGYTFEGEPPG